MKNTLPFETFLQNLKPTNRTLSFFVDWEKCLKNRDEISIYLNHLNFLLGVESENLHNKITLLFNGYPKAFKALPILLALRNENENILDYNNELCALESYFEDADKVFEFVCESGLAQIFSDRKIKDLNDFVFGVEKEFIIASFDGFCFDKNQNQKENLQILDFVYAKDVKDIKKIMADKYCGMYDKLAFYEIVR